MAQIKFVITENTDECVQEVTAVVIRQPNIKKNLGSIGSNGKLDGSLKNCIEKHKKDF